MQHDKKLHLIAGFCIAVVAAYVASRLGLPEPLSSIFGVIAAAVAGWAKEYVYDKRRPERHTVDRVDFKVTAYGGLIGGLLFAFIIHHVTIPGV